MDLNNVQLWQRLLNEAPKGSVLMGGAIVDSIYGVKPKDYDIFYHKDVVWDPPGNWKYVPIGIEGMKARQAEYDVKDKNNVTPIFSVMDYDVEVADDIKRVQVIQVIMDNPADHIKNFDHSLTLAKFTKSGVFIHNKVFDSFNNKTVELINKKNPAKSLVRANRKVAKLDPEGKNDWKYLNWE